MKKRKSNYYKYVKRRGFNSKIIQKRESSAKFQ